MAKKEAKTDLWVARMLNDIEIDFTPQGSEVLEINEVLKTASKRGTGNAGYPEYVAVIGDFVLVIEDKASVEHHVLNLDSGLISLETQAVCNYAVNGALYYAKHIAQNSSFHKVFAVGVSGTEKMHRITPMYVDDREGYVELEDIESFRSFSKDNIVEYYTRLVLNEKTNEEKTTEQILKDAAELHEYLRTYGSLKDQDKPLVVSGILLALDDKFFDVNLLKGDKNTTDGELIYEAIRRRLTASNIGPDAKRDKLMSEFAIIRTSARMNEIDDTLGKTPLKFYTEFLKRNVFDSIKYKSSSEDFIGRFYGEFMSYSGGDGQTLGIVLTPAHICSLFCDLLEVKPDDVILDPCCGTAGFLVAAMHHMVSAVDDNDRCKRIKKKQLHGYELQSNMFAIACTNMILRDDGNSNILCLDFLKQNAAMVQQKGATVGMMNPPYSQGSKNDPSQYEISFVEHLLDSLTVGARAAVIVPQSAMTNKSIEETAFKANIMKHHTLEGVITCNINTFYGVGTNPVIAVFTAHEPHPKEKICKFIDFREDGYRVHSHVGLVEEADAPDKKAHLLSVWRGEQEAPAVFCVESTVEPDDEWLHSFYYFNDEIPTEENFEKTVNDYLAFEFSMVIKNCEHLFRRHISELEYQEILSFKDIEWKAFEVQSLFDEIISTKGKTTGQLVEGNDVPYIAAAKKNNGFSKMCSKEEHPEWVSKGNAIVFVQLGNGAAGIAHYLPMDFIGMSGKTAAGYIDRHLNLYSGLFLAHCLSVNKEKFSHGHSWTGRRLLTTRVMLPANTDGSPDWNYMEQYVKNLMFEKYQYYFDFTNE